MADILAVLTNIWNKMIYILELLFHKGWSLLSNNPSLLLFFLCVGIVVSYLAEDLSKTK